MAVIAKGGIQFMIGTDGYAITVFPSTIMIPTNNDGTTPVLTNAKAKVVLYDADGAEFDTYSIIAISPTNCTATYSGNTVTITGLTANKNDGNVQVSLTALGNTYTATVYWQKARAGVAGDSGPYLVSKGVYSATKQYYGGSDRIDAVKYTDGKWYHVKNTAGGNIPIGTNPTNTSYWVLMSNFESVATGLLLAENAYIGNTSTNKIYISSDGTGADGWVLDSGSIHSVSTTNGSYTTELKTDGTLKVQGGQIGDFIITTDLGYDSDPTTPAGAFKELRGYAHWSKDGLQLYKNGLGAGEQISVRLIEMGDLYAGSTLVNSSAIDIWNTKGNISPNPDVLGLYTNTGLKVKVNGADQNHALWIEEGMVYMRNQPAYNGEDNSGNPTTVNVSGYMKPVYGKFVHPNANFNSTTGTWDRYITARILTLSEDNWVDAIDGTTDDTYVEGTPPPTTPPGGYTNETVWKWFRKNDCGTGKYGSFEQVVRYAGTYSGTSKADADTKAILNINSVGQDEANTKGSCSTQDYTGGTHSDNTGDSTVG